MNTPTPDTATARATRGFTLIEMLVVIAILGLLMTITVIGIGQYRESGRVADCSARLESIKLLIESYANRFGDYPASRLAFVGQADHNEVNEGVEALVAAFYGRDYAGRRPEESWLLNVDGDSGDGLDLVTGGQQLNELGDPWGNPLIYIANADYDRVQTYRLMDVATGDTEDVTVRAVLNPLTGTYANFDTYQIVSAGPDGFVGTEDDIANFEIEIAEDD